MKSKAWQQCQLIVFALWWGGLTFYAAIVVPIGSSEFGSTPQGFATQQVALWHNGLLAATTLLVLIDAIQSRTRWVGLLACAMVAMNLALLYQHTRLTEWMDFQQQDVHEEFYSRHAIYLWLTTVEWVLGFPVLFRFTREQAPT